MKNRFSIATLPGIEGAAFLIAETCVFLLQDAPGADQTVMLIEGSGFAPREVELATNALPTDSRELAASVALLADDGSKAIVFACEGIPSDVTELRVTRLQNGRPVACQDMALQRLPAVLSSPRGVVICAWARSEDLDQVTVLADGKPLARTTDTCNAQTTALCAVSYALPEALFDGKPHLFAIKFKGDHSCIQTLEWTCADLHMRERIASSLDWDHLANSFPPHEIDRVASFLVNKSLPPADRPMAAPPMAGSAMPQCDLLFVHHLTGVGAIASPTISNATEVLAGNCRTFALLPSPEAIAYTVEIGRGAALTQQVSTIALPALRQRLAALADAGRAIFLPGGAILSDEGAAILASADGRVHASVPARTLVRPGWQLDVQPHVASLDLFEACAIIPASTLNHMLEFGSSRHDEAIIPTCRVTTATNTLIARIISSEVTPDPRHGGYRLLIDAQRNVDAEAFEALLAPLLALTPHCVVVGPRTLLLKLKESPHANSIAGIISLDNAVALDNPAITAAMSPLPSLGICADAVAPILSLPAQEFSLAVAFALHHTRQKSECRLAFAADGSRPDAEPSEVHMTCMLPE